MAKNDAFHGVNKRPTSSHADGQLYDLLARCVKSASADLPEIYADIAAFIVLDEHAQTLTINGIQPEFYDAYESIAMTMVGGLKEASPMQHAMEGTADVAMEITMQNAQTFERVQRIVNQHIYPAFEDYAFKGQGPAR